MHLSEGRFERGRVLLEPGIAMQQSASGRFLGVLENSANRIQKWAGVTSQRCSVSVSVYPYKNVFEG